MRVALLHNPGSGDEDHRRAELESVISEAGHTVEYRSLREESWSEVLAEQVDLIVVAGGDGSVRKVFTAIGAEPTVVLVVPLGSANNISRTLGLDLDDAFRLLTGAHPHEVRPFDVWDVESTWGRSRCIEAAGGGLFADILARAEAADHEPSGADKVDFGLELLERTVHRAEALSWTIEIDGTRTRDELLGVEAMNIREIGANLPFAPAADAGDGLLDVVLVRPEDRSELAEYVGARLRGEDAPQPRFEVLKGRSIVFEPPSQVRLHVDDLLPAWDLSTTSWVEVSRADAAVTTVAGEAGA